MSTRLRQDGSDRDSIEALGIGDDGTLWVKPASSSFPFIYRAGIGISWDPARLCLLGARPKEFSHDQWIRQILNAAREEHGVLLALTPETRWLNIGADLRHEIEALPPLEVT